MEFNIRRRSSMAERQLPKLNTGVRFPSPAPKTGKSHKICLFYLFTIHYYFLLKSCSAQLKNRRYRHAQNHADYRWQQH